MDDILGLLLDLADHQCNKKLSSDERYCRLSEERKALWEAFRAEQRKEVRKAVLAMLDRESERSDIRAAYCLLLGMQLGFAVGGLDLVG